MGLDVIKKNGYIIGAIGGIQYIVITAIAMFIYPGGSQSDPNAEGYTFFGNYFSDLGHSVAINGQVNTISQILYILATAVYGVSLIIFSFKAVTSFKEKGKGKIAGKISLVSGILAGIGTLTYALTPADLVPMAHNAGVAFGYLGTFLLYIFIGIAIVKAKEFPIRNGYLFIFTGILYFITLIVGGMFSGNVFITMLMQKSGKYLTMIVLVIEGFLLKEYFKNE